MTQSTRFFKWYRTIPLLAVALVAAVSLALTITPAPLLRHFVYPISYRETILAASMRHGVDPALVCAVIKCESDWNDEAMSSAGAIGLMQLMPDTAATISNMGLVSPSYDPTRLTDADTNIEFGAAYLGYLQGIFDAQDEVLAAYNAGLGTVQSWLTNDLENLTFTDAIAYPETRLYLLKVNEAYTRYQDLYDADLSAR